jgi:RIO kinase 1
MEPHLSINPDWLTTSQTTDSDLGVLCSGKEAQINVIERRDERGRSSLIARKRYVPRRASQKGELEALGVQRASAFRNDVVYREGRQFRKSRDRRAVEQMTAHGRRLLQERWTDHEYNVLDTLHGAGVPVPYPIAYADDVLDMEYLGDRSGAAPQLAKARLEWPDLVRAFDQMMEGLADITAAGWVHGDLSAYNLLWWQDRLWFIDFPQAVDIAANPQGLGFLHRDVSNVCDWFRRRGLDVDEEEQFADLLASAF